MSNKELLIILKPNMDTTIRALRCGNGENFRNLKHAMWGFKKTSEGDVVKFRSGDILIFCTNKSAGLKVIGLATVPGKCYDRRDEPFISFNTYSNEEMGWEGEDDWCIQTRLENVINIEHLNYTHSLNGARPIRYYKEEDFEQDIEGDLENLFKFLPRVF